MLVAWRWGTAAGQLDRPRALEFAPLRSAIARAECGTLHGGDQPLGRDRDVGDARAGRVLDRVGDRRNARSGGAGVRPRHSADSVPGAASIAGPRPAWRRPAARA